MVGFGQSLQDTRRQGWEAAYLDYGCLQEILNQMEAECIKLESKLMDNQSSEDYESQINELSNQFTSKLQQEIEKVSLFSLSKIGDVANA